LFRDCTFNLHIERVIENNLITNRKQNALKVLTNTVQSIKKSDDKNLKQSKVVPMKKFDAETKCKSVLHNTVSNQIEELGHFDCMTKDEGNFV